VLKKRATLRQLVLSLQSRLNPGLQYDVRQGTVLPSAPPMPETPAAADSMSVDNVCVGSAGDADLLNPITSDDAADLLQTTTVQTVSLPIAEAPAAKDSIGGAGDANLLNPITTDNAVDLLHMVANEHGLSEAESENTGSSAEVTLPAVTDHVSDHGDVAGVVSSSCAPTAATGGGSDAESVILPSVSTLSLTDNTSDSSSLPASADPQTLLSSGFATISRLHEPAGITLSSETSQNVETTIAGASSVVIPARDDTRECSSVLPLTVFKHLVNECTDNAADAGDVALCATDSTEELCIADSSDNKNASHISDTASCATEDSISPHRIVPSVTTESFVGNSAADLLPNSSCQPSAAETANS